MKLFISLPTFSTSLSSFLTAVASVSNSFRLKKNKTIVCIVSITKFSKVVGSQRAFASETSKKN